MALGTAAKSRQRANRCSNRESYSHASQQVGFLAGAYFKPTDGSAADCQHSNQYGIAGETFEGPDRPAVRYLRTRDPNADPIIREDLAVHRRGEDEHQ
jgi:hypothetical protein